MTPDNLAEWYEQAQRTVEHVSLPGHDRDCALAMLSQARLSEERGRLNPHQLSQTQAEHLLQIGSRAGLKRGLQIAAKQIIAAARRLQVEADATDDAARQGQLIDEIEGMWAAARIAEPETWRAARDEAGSTA